MSELVRAADPMLRRVAFGAFFVCIAGFVAGGGLVWLGETGTSEISLLGQHLSTTSTGIAGMFLGVVPGAVVVLRVLASFDKTVATESVRGDDGPGRRARRR